MKINKQLILFLLFFYFFLFRDYLEQISILKFVDEIVALMAVPIFALQLKRDHFRLKASKVFTGYGRYIVLLILIGIISSLCFLYQPAAAAFPDLFIVVKFWLAIYVGKFFIQGFLSEKNADVIFFHTKLMTWLYVVLVLLDYISGDFFRASIRYGLRSTQLFYSHPTVFAGCCVFLTTVLLSIRDWVSGSEKYLITLLLLSCSTLRSKAIAVAFAIALVYYFAYVRKKKVGLKTVALFVPIVVAIGWEQIEFYFFSSIQSDSARYQLLVKSIQIANDCFPLGAGFATFGSYFSGIYYSPLYEMYGISNVHGLNAGGAFISDSFWPMILGQFGWFGLIAYGLSVFMLFLRIQKMRTHSKAFYVSGLCILIYLLIASMAEAAFVHPLAIPFAVWLGMLFQKQDQINSKKRQLHLEI